MRTRNRFLNLLVMAAAGTMLFSTFSVAANLALKTKDGLGTYLTDDKGMTLYLFKKDAPGKSACGAANGCLEKWPVFLADESAPAAGIDPASLGVITRDDGIRQSTYKGQPLYYFFKDKNGDDAHGQGVNNVWYVVNP